MTVADVVNARGITEVVHFTTENGLLGILATHALKSRDLLNEDQYLEHILHLNTPRVLDPGWKRHVNLSITRINKNLFDIANGWHKTTSWRILAFDPEILSHKDVIFVTTNNAYHQHLFRGKGGSGLEALFAKKVLSRYGTPIVRSDSEALNHTTDIQAEALYPEFVDTKHLKRIYVPSDHDQSVVVAQMRVINFPKVDVVIAPEKFVN